MRLSKRSGLTAVYAAASAALVLLAVAAHSEPAREAQLNDGGVWVLSEKDGAVGRYVYDIGQLDARIGLAGNGLDVLQDGTSVLVWDRTAGTLTGVDPALRQLSPQKTVLAPGSQVAMAGGTVAALDPAKGELRVGRTGDGVATAGGVDATAAPVLSDLKDGRVTVTTSGDVVVARPGELVTVPSVLGGGFGTPRRVKTPASQAQPDVTAVGSVAVVLDPQAGELVVPSTGAHASLAAQIGGRTRLQAPGPAAGTVAVAGDPGLALVDLTTGAVSVVASGSQRPAIPVRVGSCVYGAWQSGAYARSCNDAKAPPSGGFKASTDPVFRVNRGVVVLNDAPSGAVLAAENELQDRNVWTEIDQNSSKQQQTTSTTPDHSQPNKAPEPQNDTYGARPGRATVLHVLDNDTDPERDVLVISKVEAPSLPGTSAIIAPDGQSLVLTLPPDATGVTQLRYFVDDGYGGSAAAGVAVTARSVGQNAAPSPRAGAKPLALSVAAGGNVRLPVLADWRDPEDGDPLTLQNATTSTPGASVAVTSDGALLVTASPAEGKIDIGFEVTDGLTSAPPKGTASVTVLKPGDPQALASPTARPDVARGVVGQPLVILPLANDLPGGDSIDHQAVLTLAGPVTLRPAQSSTSDTSMRIDTDQETGKVTVTPSREGSTLLSYSAGFGSASPAAGLIRVDAVAATGTPGPPVAMPDSAVLHGQKPTVVDVLANDADPSGQMLVVQDAQGDDSSGLSVAVIDGRLLRIVSTGSGTGRSGNVSYRITNGVSEPVTGSVAVTLTDASAVNNPPVPLPDSVTVRAGDSTAVQVLDNDFDPDGDPLVLSAVPPVVTPAVPGVVASASGRTLRLAAPATLTQPTQVSVDYVVEDPSGDRRVGTVAVSIVPPLAPGAADRAPSPRDLEARLVAGDTYKVDVPVYGVDPDGDSVTVTQVSDPPSLGRILSIGPDTVTYQSYPDSGGTDSFGYEVVDRYGQVGRATVRLAVVPPGALSPPVAVDDRVAAKPGLTVHLDVTQNDLVSPGVAPHVVPLADVGSVPRGVRLDGNVISVVVPAAGTPPIVVTYGITDGSAEPSTATLTVSPDPSVQLPPVARDDAPPADTPLDAPITVDVRANDDDPDGSTADLVVSVPPTPGVTVADGKITVSAEDSPRQIPYTVTDGQQLMAVAALRVPGKGDLAPRLKPGARIQVDVGGSANVNLADLVTSPRGRPVRITTTDRLSHSPVKALGVSATDNTTLVVQALGSYAGPGAVSFEVTDGSSLQDPDGKTVTLSVPAQVGPSAPVLRCPTTPLDVVQGGKDTSANLLSLCHVWVDTTVHPPPVTFAITPQAAGVSASVKDDTVVVLTASSSASPGATGDLTLTVPGGPATAQLPVKVIAAPLAKVRTVSLEGLRAGQPRALDLASSVASPLREPRLSVVSVTQTAGGPAPAVKSGETGITITPGRDTFGTVVHAVVMTDVANQPSRQVTVIVTSQVQGRPSAPTGVTTVGVGDREATLTWTPPANNGAPITSYRISGDGVDFPCAAAPCRVTGLTNDRTYTLTVQATNVVDTSDPSGPTTARPDAVPGLVTSVLLTPGDSSLQASWVAPSNAGSPIRDYLVGIDGRPSEYVSATTKLFTGLTNGQEYRVTVQARNSADANGGLAPRATEATQKPFGTPVSMAAPDVEGAPVPTPKKERAVTVSWPAADGNGSEITGYTVTPFTSSSENGTFSAQSPVEAAATARSQSFTVSNDGTFYRYTITATNAAVGGVPGKTSAPSPQSAAIQGAAPPDKIESVTADDHPDGQVAGYDNKVRVRLSVPSANAQAIRKITLTPTAGTAVTINDPGPEGTAIDQMVTVPNNNKNVTVTAEACNDAGLCTTSAASNAVNPYGPPIQPVITRADQNGNVVTFGWDDRGENGRPITVTACFTDVACQTMPGEAGAGSLQHDYGYSRSWTISVTVKDSLGQETAPVTAGGRTPDAPPPAAAISAGQGNAATGQGCDSTCHWLAFTVSNFSTGSFTWECITNGAVSYQSTARITISSPNQTFTGGSGSSGYCFWGSGVGPEAIKINGVTSNAVPHS